MDYPKPQDLYQGKFTDGDPIAGISASVASAEHMNAIYDELISVIKAGGLQPEATLVNQVSVAIQQQIYGQRIFIATGGANDIVLVSETNHPAITLLTEYDQVKVRVSSTNTALVTVKLDDMAVLNVTNITAANQLFSGALATFTYLDGALHLTEQINPTTGNVTRDIGKLIVDTTDILEVGEIALDGATLNRTDFPVLWAKVQATSNLMEQATKDAEPETYTGFYGTGDGSTTFTLPNLGGEFIRMADNGRGIDAGRGFGSWQEDTLQEHSHKYRAYWREGSSDEVDTSNKNFTSRERNTTGVVNARHSNETRPRNIAYYAKTRV